MLNFIQIFWDTGLKLRCPVCEQGKLFADWFNMNPTCPHCYVRFERYEGEVVGGMSISIVVTAVIFLVGYMLGEYLTDWSVWVHLAIWIPYSLIFPIFFYRYSRALWVVILHVGGDVHWDYEPYEETSLSIVDAFHSQHARRPAPALVTKKNNHHHDESHDDDYLDDLANFPFKDDDFFFKDEEL